MSEGMIVGLENLTKLVYPGRFTIIGMDATGENNVVVYGITGRSPPSRARKLELAADIIKVLPTDEEEVKKGNPDLLIYDAAIDARRAITVSNGAQTESIATAYLKYFIPTDVVVRSFSLNKKWSYEDDKYFTPRIGGLVTRENDTTVLAILKKAENGGTLRNYFEFPLHSGKGKGIATYAGPNIEPIPSFSGEPFDVELKGKTPEEIAEAVYSAIGPEYRNGENYRVSVAVAFQERNVNEIKNDFFIINRSERGE